jgi:hypothetical protein
MKDAEAEIAAWMGKATVMVLIFAVVAAWWLFALIVRFTARMLAGVAVEQGWIADDVTDGELRLAGAFVGGVIGSLVSLFVLAGGGPLVAGGIVAIAGTILGGLVEPAETDPWRAQPLGSTVDDWLGDEFRD